MLEMSQQEVSLWLADSCSRDLREGEWEEAQRMDAEEDEKNAKNDQ